MYTFAHTSDGGCWLKVQPSETKVLFSLPFVTAMKNIYLSQLTQGKTILINSRGGYCYKENKSILRERKRSLLDWD